MTSHRGETRGGSHRLTVLTGCFLALLLLSPSVTGSEEGSPRHLPDSQHPDGGHAGHPLDITAIHTTGNFAGAPAETFAGEPADNNTGGHPPGHPPLGQHVTAEEVGAEAEGHGEHHGDGHGDGHGGHHGVSLASWRWSTYSHFLIISLTIILVGVFKILFHHYDHIIAIPESCVLIIIGIVCGLVLYFSNLTQSFPKFTSELFFNVLLPPIILDAAYAIYDRNFLGNLATVLIYAVFGTLFNVFVIGYGLYFVNYIGWMGFVGPSNMTAGDAAAPELDTIQCLTFSSLISAVDPVAVLAIFQEIGVNISLYFLVFGESLLNDGVTVVLYNTMLGLGGSENPDQSQYVLAFFSFFTVVLGGLTIGAIVGLLCSFIVKFTKSIRDVEPLIIFVTAYFAYILAETIHWSGIISLIGCGIAQKRYAFRNISKKTYTTVKYSTRTLAGFSDCIIFLFLGITCVRDSLEWNIFYNGFAWWTLLFCLVVRFCGVFALTAVINTKRVKKIPIKEQFILAYGGLRGAVGFSLVEILDEHNPLKATFLTTTLFIILVTVFLQGSTIKWLVGKLEIKTKSQAVKLISNDVNQKTVDNLMAGVEAVTGGVQKHVMLEKIKKLDHDYLQKLLVREDAESLLTLRLKKISLEEHNARLYGPTVMATKMSNKVAQHKHVELDPEEARRKLQEAFSSNAFERYKHRGINGESAEKLADELEKEQEKRAKVIWSSAIKGVRAKIRTSTLSNPGIKSSDSQGSTPPISANASYNDLVSADPNADSGGGGPPKGEKILQIYRLAKTQFKVNADNAAAARARASESPDSDGQTSDEKFTRLNP